MTTSRVLSHGVLALLMATSAYGQQPPPPTHEQKFEASYVGVTGNASSNTFGLGADLISRPDSWVIRNRASFVRNESNDVLLANALAVTSRAEKTVNRRASAFGEYGFFRDRFAGVVQRNSGTGGLALKVVATSRQSLGIDVGTGYVNESRLAGRNVSSGSYLVGSGYKLAIGGTSTLDDDLRLTGLFSDGPNWRLEHTVALTTRVASGLSLKVSHGIRFAHRPPPGFRRTDSTMGVALVARFTRP